MRKTPVYAGVFRISLLFLLYGSAIGNTPNWRDYFPFIMFGLRIILRRGALT